MQFSVFFCKGKIFLTRKLKPERSGLAAMASANRSWVQVWESISPKKKKFGDKTVDQSFLPNPAKVETLCTGYNLLES